MKINKYILKFLLLFLLLVSLLIPVSNSYSVEKLSCIKLISQMLGGDNPKWTGSEGYGVDINFEHYRNSNNILLLSDKPHDISIGDELAQMYPEKRIVSTDYGYSDDAEVIGNYTKMRMDNTQSFLFDDDSFDTIVLRRGLCVCHEGKACAGFHALGPGADQFFGEVVRVLNKRKAGSRAVLHGSYKVDANIESKWQGIFRKLEKEYNIKARFHHSVATGEFNSIEILSL